MIAKNVERFGKLLSGRIDYRVYVKDLTQQHKYVVFYGCGRIFGSMVSMWAEKIGRKIDFCCDADPQKWGKVFHGCVCISPAELRAIGDDCVVFVTVGNFEEIYRSLQESGIASVQVLFKYDLVAGALLKDSPVADTASRMAQVYDFLADQRSRDVFDAVVSRVLSPERDISIMARVCSRDQYFPKGVINLSDEESFVDVGAFDGDTIREFLHRTGARFERIFSFELNVNMFQLLQRCVSGLSARARITTFNLGAWDTAGELPYSLAFSESAVGVGEGRAHVAPLDEALCGQRVTYLKMDIEGAEPRALRGAKGILGQQKPKLAVCVYHDFRHLWEIPLYLKELVPGYKIYLRHHTNLEYETVCYAVP